LIINFTI